MSAPEINKPDQIGKYCDYTPVVSTLKSCYDLYQKHKYSGADISTLPTTERTYVQYVKDKEDWRMYVALVPVIGNIILGLYDFLHKAPEEAAPLASTTTPVTGITIGSLNLKAISKKVDPNDDYNVIFSDGKNSYSIRIPFLIREKMGDPLIPERLELYEDTADSTLRPRLITEENFTLLSDTTSFQAKPEDHSHIYTSERENGAVVIFNDRDKTYAKLKVPNQQYSATDFTPEGKVIVHFKPHEVATTLLSYAPNLQKRKKGTHLELIQDETVLQSVTLPDDWSNKSANELELFLTNKGTLAIREIRKENFRQVPFKPIYSQNPFKLPSEFKVSRNYSANLFFQKEGDTLTIYNDRTKCYIELPHLPNNYKGPFYWEDGSVQLLF